MIVDWQSQYVAVPGMMLELTCATDEVSVERVWLKNNRRVESEVDSSGSLLVANVMRMDRGSYICVVWNDLGIDYRTTSVSIGELKLYGLELRSLIPRLSRCIQQNLKVWEQGYKQLLVHCLILL